MKTNSGFRAAPAVAFLAAALAVAGCGGGGDQPDREVVVYTALDQQFSEPILETFEAETGIRVRPVYDLEATKTVGLVNRLIAERDRPVCDVFWNNEIVRSLQLKREGLTQAYVSPSAESIPPELRDPESHWTGFAARARVLLVNTELLPDPSEHPDSVDDLTDPKWQGRAAFAKPLFGTTSTHAAILLAGLGEEGFRRFWASVLENAVMVAGNAQARDAVRDGEMAWCLTDTDDAYGAVLDGAPVRIVYPDDEADQAGIVLIPNTLVLVRDCPNPEEGKELIDYLLSREVEARLAQSRSAQIPVREGIAPPPGLEPLAGRKLMDIDWGAVEGALMRSQETLREMLGESD